MPDVPSPGSPAALPADERPLDHTPIHTIDLPPTPTRDRNIPATAWVEAPTLLLTAGDDLGVGPANFKRRIGRWLLWRAGPAVKAHARYVALDHDDLGRSFVFRLFADGSGHGVGPSGVSHASFRRWKEDLRDHSA